MGGVAIVLAAIFFFDPATSWFLPACPLHSLTGLYCAGCGSTRAMHHLLHGDVAGAFWLNPLLVGAVPVVIGLGLWRLATGHLPAWLGKPVVGWMLLTGAVVFGMMRNVPLYPFTLLKP